MPEIVETPEAPNPTEKILDAFHLGLGGISKKIVALGAAASFGLGACAPLPARHQARGGGASVGFVQEGEASWYGRFFHRRMTASGEPYDMYALTAAHKTLPLGSLVRVTRLDNGRRVTVRINDRGPYAKGRIIDLSKKAARKLGMVDKGVAKVRIEVIR